MFLVHITCDALTERLSSLTGVGERSGIFSSLAEPDSHTKSGRVWLGMVLQTRATGNVVSRSETLAGNRTQTVGVLYGQIDVSFEGHSFCSEVQ